MKHRRWKTSWVLLAVALFVLGLLLWGVFEAHWELWRPLEMGQTVTLHGDGLSIYCIKFSPDDTQLAAAGSDGTIRIWDTGNWHLRTSLVGHVRSVYTVCFTPDGNSLVSGGNDGTVRLWDLQSGRKSIILRTFKREVAVVCFSPDGKYLAAAATDLADTEEITVWDLATKQEWSKQQELSYSSKAVAFSPDGRSLAIGGSTGHPKIWHFKDGTETMLPAGNDSIDGIAYAPTGTILAGVDGGVMVWDLVAEQEFVRLKKPRFHFHCVSFSPDGKLLAAGGPGRRHQSGQFTLWELKTRNELMCIEGHKGQVYTVAFSHDGRLLATAGFDGTVKVWDIPRLLSH